MKLSTVNFNIQCMNCNYQNYGEIYFSHNNTMALDTKLNDEKIDGVINYQTLVDIKKDKLWLMKMLKNEHTSLEQVFYAFYKNNKCFIIKKN